jgi:hypothetical protein
MGRLIGIGDVRHGEHMIEEAAGAGISRTATATHDQRITQVGCI